MLAAMPASPRLDAFGLVVTDMARTLAFYRALGLDIPDGAEREPHVEVELNGGIRLLFDPVSTVRSFLPDWTAPAGGHRMGLAMRCESPAQVDETHARVVGLGYDSHKDPWDAPWGQRYAIVVDPEGNPVDLYAQLS